MRELPHDRIFVKAYAFSGQAKSWNVWGQMIDRTTDRLVDWSGWFQVHSDQSLRLGWPEASPRENRNRLFHCVWMYGKSYQCSDAVKVRIVRRVENILADLPEVRDLAIGVQASMVVTERPATPKTLRGDFMETNETKVQSVKIALPTFGQCEVKPQTGAKHSARCPHAIRTQGERICNLHLFARDHRHAELVLVDGTTFNPKPVAEPKAPKSTKSVDAGTRVDLSPAEPTSPTATFNVASAETMAEVNGNKPPADTTVLTPKGKKQSKRAKADAALQVLKAKDAQQSEQATN